MAVCVGVLEGCPEPLALMTELGRILAPGGRLYLISPLTVPEPGRAQFRTSGAERRRYGLNYLLDAASLEIQHLKPLERASAYAVIARRSARRGDRSTGR